MTDDVEFGHVVDLTLGEPSGTELVAAAAIGATTLTVDYAGDFEDAGEVVLNGSTLAYTSIAYGAAETDPDVITLAAPLAAAAVVDDKVVRVSGGEPLSDWLLHVSLGDGHPVDIPIPFEQRALWSSVDTSTPVPVMVSADLERLVEVPGREPQIDGSFIDPTSTIPGGQAFSLDAPSATDGYPEDYGWWQVDATGNVLGFWRLVGGVWVQHTVAPVLVGETINGVTITGSTITGTTVTGGTVQTATSGPRWKMTSTSTNELLGYTGGANETAPARLNVGTGPNDYYVQFYSPVRSGVTNTAQLQLITSPTEAVVQVFGDKVFVSGSSSIDLSATSINFTGEARWTAATANSWTTYTPTFTAATTNPTLGSFTRAGRWSQWGKTIRFSIVITATAASGYGSGTYEFGLPVAARNADEIVVTGAQTGPNHGYIGRSSGGSTSAITLTLTSTDAAINATNSGMANGTVLRITGTYEAA